MAPGSLPLARVGKEALFVLLAAFAAGAVAFADGGARAAGGFLVAAEFRNGEVLRAEVRSLWGRPCRVACPWQGPWVVREGDRVLAQGKEPTIRFATKPNASYAVEPP